MGRARCLPKRRNANYNVEKRFAPERVLRRAGSDFAVRISQQSSRQDEHGDRNMGKLDRDCIYIGELATVDSGRLRRTINCADVMVPRSVTAESSYRPSASIAPRRTTRSRSLIPPGWASTEATLNACGSPATTPANRGSRYVASPTRSTVLQKISYVMKAGNLN